MKVSKSKQFIITERTKIIKYKSKNGYGIVIRKNLAENNYFLLLSYFY